MPALHAKPHSPREPCVAITSQAMPGKPSAHRFSWCGKNSDQLRHSPGHAKVHALRVGSVEHCLVNHGRLFPAYGDQKYGVLKVTLCAEQVSSLLQWQFERALKN